MDLKQPVLLSRLVLAWESYKATSNFLILRNGYTVELHNKLMHQGYTIKVRQWRCSSDLEHHTVSCSEFPTRNLAKALKKLKFNARNQWSQPVIYLIALISNERYVYLISLCTTDFFICKLRATNLKQHVQNVTSLRSLILWNNFNKTGISERC